MISYFPKYFSSKAIYLYIALLIVISLIFGYPMRWYWWILGLVEVIAFFYAANQLTYEWGRRSDVFFEKKLFSTSLTIRLIYVIFSYFFYERMTGQPFEFHVADASWYHDMANLGSSIIWGADIKWSVFTKGVDISDLGYPTYLAVIYALTGKSVLLARCVKALISAMTVVFVYRIAVRNFGRETGRMAAVFCMLMPNLIYYCGLHLKETEMLFLTAWFIDRADVLIRSRKITIRSSFPVLLIGIATFFFRDVLCYVLFLALFTALLFSSKRIVRWGRSAAIGLLAVALVGVVVYNQFHERIEMERYSDITEQQQGNMEWRAEREGGNQFARYAGSAVFAPLIFTIPFPTMVDIPDQENQQMIHGGNYVKNITSFFTIIALISLLMSRKWKEHVLPAAFFIGYLVVLVFSNYAQSERFHIPILPFSLMFAAYGVSLMTNKHKLWFQYWLLFIFVANIGWAWFKLRGRGL